MKSESQKFYFLKILFSCLKLLKCGLLFLLQNKRLGSLNKFKAKARSILLATDVASRGLDIPHVDVVINFDIPTHSKVSWKESHWMRALPLKIWDISVSFSGKDRRCFFFHSYDNSGRRYSTLWILETQVQAWNRLGDLGPIIHFQPNLSIRAISGTNGEAETCMPS